MRPLLTPSKVRAMYDKQGKWNRRTRAHLVFLMNNWLLEYGAINASRGAHNAKFQKFAQQLSAAFGIRFTFMDVVSEVNYIKDRYSEFKRFKSLPGVKYDRKANLVTIGHAYLMRRGMEANFEMPMETYFRLTGCPSHDALFFIFDVKGLGYVRDRFGCRVDGDTRFRDM